MGFTFMPVPRYGILFLSFGVEIRCIAFLLEGGLIIVNWGRDVEF
jgi:hypothetical protein